jgi:chromate transporter
MGGPSLALLTMMVWAAPVILLMTLLSFLYDILGYFHLSSDALRLIGPMAVGFIVVSAFRIGKKVLANSLTWGLFLLAAIVTYIWRDVWVFPVVLLMGGIVSIIAEKEPGMWNRVKIRFPWRYFFAFVILAIGSATIILVWDHPIMHLFASFYRYGYLVFGGGQVVVPMMVNELVDQLQYLSIQEFLVGYGLVQGLPGPMFSFSAYAGGMAVRGSGILSQVGAALVSGLGIFLPGILLIFFVYPVWQDLKQIKAIRISLRGINAVAGGLIATSSVLLLQKSGITWTNIVVVGLTILLLSSKKIPAPVIVILAILAGFLL